jgi:putative tryptophan/tyrosine transport system substrate-binding protein
MRRREFITLLGGAAATWPLAAYAQQGDRMRRIGVLMGTVEGDPEAQRYIKSFLQGLQALSWVPGRNVQIETRWGGADTDRIRSYASELVGLKSDVILAQTSLVVVPLQRETRTVPIVFMQINDPVESGLVASMAHPGGNITGFTSFELTVGGKWLEMLKEIAPGVTRVAVILNPVQSPQVAILRAIEAVAPSVGVPVTAVGVQDAAGLEPVVSAFARGSNGGLIVLPNPVTIGNRKLIIGLAARHRLPAVYAYRYFVTDGGLMAYGVDVAALYRRAAGYVDSILKGEKPADLPVQAPTKYDQVINLKTAKALGLSVSPTLLTRADEVIE